MAVSSSRRNVVKGLLAGSSALLGGAWLWARTATPSASPATQALPGLRLGLLRGAESCPSLSAEQTKKELALGAWISFATLSAPARTRLLETVEGLVDRVEARMHPLGIDFSNEPLAKTLQREAGWFFPIWTAARTLSQRCFVAGDRSLAVTVPDTPHADFAGQHSFDARARDQNSDTRLARFLAWPICSAWSLRLETSNAPLQAWEKVRQRTSDPKSNIALLIDQHTQDVAATALIDVETLKRMGELRERCAGFGQPDCEGCDWLGDMLTALTAPPPSAPALSWLELNPGEAWVIPRLGSLRQPDAFRRELDELSEVRVLG